MTRLLVEPSFLDSLASISVESSSASPLLSSIGKVSSDAKGSASIGSSCSSSGGFPTITCSRGIVAEETHGNNTSRSNTAAGDPHSSEKMATSLDGRVPISKSKIVGLSPLSAIPSILKGSAVTGTSYELFPTLPFPLSYLDFLGKAICLAKES
jgi:hypothetical protein